MSETITNIDNSSGLANSLFTTLTSGVTIPPSPDFTDPKFVFTPDTTSELYKDIVGSTIDEVTKGDHTLTGNGTFDVFMQAMDKHLEREFKGNRLTGSQYAEAYTAIANQVLGQAVSFTLQKDQARWAAVTAQMQARITEIQATEALVNLERAKLETAQKNFELNLTAAQYALTKMSIAVEEAKHDDVTTGVAMKEYEHNFLQPADLAIKDYERSAVMPSTVAMNDVQTSRILPAQAAISEFQNRILQPLEQDLQTIQRDRILPVQADMAEFQRDNMQPVELAQQQHILNYRQPAETELLNEQTEVQRSSTLDTRRDGLTAVGGVVSIQKRNLTSDANIKDYTLGTQLPAQVSLVQQQTTLTSEQSESERANTMDTRSDGLTTVSGVVSLQKRNLTSDADIKDYTLTNQLPAQVSLVQKQVILTVEQGEAERAKTLNVRSDGGTVVGSVGKQKDLYTQQIDSFVKDAQHKAAKMYLDGYITQKTLDEGLPVPNELTQTEINSVLAGVRSNNSL